MELIILNYELGDVELIRNVPENIENLDDFVYNILKYKESEVSWMLLEDDFRTILYTYDELQKKKVYDNENYISYD